MLRVESNKTLPPLGEGGGRVFLGPRRYPHRNNHVYTVRGFQRVLDNLSKNKALTDAQRRNLTDLYFGRKFRKYLDEEGFYRRSLGLWRVGRECRYAYRVKSLFDLVERSGIFYCCYDETGQMVAFKSKATWKEKGGQMTLQTLSPDPLP